MLNQVLDLIKGQALNAISNNTDVPAEKKEAAVETTTSVIMDGLKDEFTPDNFASVMELVSGDHSTLLDSSLISNIQNSVVLALSEKVGLSPNVASSIAGTVIPAVVKLLTNKSNDSSDSFSFESLFKSFTGDGKGGGILGSIAKLFGK